MSRRRNFSTLATSRTPAGVFAALGDPTRLQLVQRLSRGDACSIAMLTADTDFTRQAVTKHLRVLAGAGLVRAEPSGRETRFEFDPAQIAAARSYLESVSRQWDDALGRLKAFVEKPKARK